MNTIPASEIKRRGISVVDDALKHGPVHVIQRNHPRYVILSKDQYQRLVPKREGARTKQDIDAQVAEERAGWNKSSAN